MDKRKNVITYFFGKIIPALCQLAILTFGVRLLGKAEFGKYILLFNAAMIISSLAAGWIQQSILRFFFSYRENRHAAIRKFYQLALLAALFSLVTGLITGTIYFQLNWISNLVFSGVTALMTLLFVELTIRQVQFKSLGYATMESSYYLFSLLIAFALIYFFSMNNSFAFFYGMFITLTVLLAGKLLFQLFFTASKSANTQEIVKKDFLIRMFGFGFPLTLWLLISGLFNYSDRYIIQHYTTLDQVGAYSAIYDFVYKVSAFLCMPVLLSYHPAISQSWEEKKFSECRRLIKKLIGFELFILVLLIVGYLLFSDWIFNVFILLREKNLLVTVIPLAVSSILWQSVLFIQKPLEMLFMQKKMLWCISLTLLLNILCNIWFIPIFGYPAAAYSTLMCTLVYCFAAYYFSANEFNKIIHA